MRIIILILFIVALATACNGPVTTVFIEDGTSMNVLKNEVGKLPPPENQEYLVFMEHKPGSQKFIPATYSPYQLRTSWRTNYRRREYVKISTQDLMYYLNRTRITYNSDEIAVH